MSRGRSARLCATAVLAFAAVLMLLAAGCGDSWGDGDPRRTDEGEYLLVD